MIKDSLMQLVLFLRKCVRLIVYAFFWILLLNNFGVQNAAMAKTYDATKFVGHIIPIVFEIAGLLILPLVFFFTRTENENYPRWAVFGIAFLLAILLIPSSQPYLLSLINIPALYKTACTFAFCAK